MHRTAMLNGELFFNTYAKAFSDDEKVKVVDIGSQDVNGSLRSVCPERFEYIGVDFQQANGVDIVIDDPYHLPFDDESLDIVVSSSCFEHSEMFWLVYLEVLRVLKPSGLFYVNVPSAGSYHCFPVDCWRFFPDSGSALVKWGNKNGYNDHLLESFVQLGGEWYDFIGVFIKDKTFSEKFSERIIDSKTDFENGKRDTIPEMLNQNFISQDLRKLITISNVAAEAIIV